MMMKTNACGPCGKPTGVFQPKAEGGGFPVGRREGPVGNTAIGCFPREGPCFPWEIRARAGAAGGWVGVLTQAAFCLKVVDTFRT